jgi:hypothetical protein
MRIPEESYEQCWAFVHTRAELCQRMIIKYLDSGPVEARSLACEAARMAWGLALDLTGEREES